MNTGSRDAQTRGAFNYADYSAAPRQIEVLSPRRLGGELFIVLFGVLLPAASVLVELLTRVCTSDVFDPLPTPLHAALALAVPLGNLLVWRVSRNRLTRGLAILGTINGVAIGAALCYALAFLQFTPFAIIGILLFGLGLLPLGPIFGLIAALKCRQRLKYAADPRMVRQVAGLWPGFIAAVVFLVGSIVPGVVTRYGLEEASAAESERSDAGVRFLRTWGDQRELLRSCYWGRRGGLDPFWIANGGNRFDTEEAQKIFYRVTGTGFDTHPIPRSNRAGWFADTSWDNGDTDWELRGGEQVGGRLDGLTVAASRIDGSVNADAATAYFEWIIEFKNDKSFPQEARCRIALPRDGVVSRLTLWINGEEREAAFGGRAKVREAYEQVVKVQRRDPVLVTSAGPDRVQMQCFPVPAGGFMKVRVGITAPLQLESLERGKVRLPSFVSRNFAVPTGPAHTVWIESRAPLSAAASTGLSFEHAGSGEDHSALTGSVADAELVKGLPLIVSGPTSPIPVWFDDPYDKSVGTIVQRFEQYTEAAPTRIVLAMDASAPMAPVLPIIADAIGSLPTGTALDAVISRDGLIELQGDPNEIASRLKAIECVGGQDAVPALARAWGLAAGNPNAVVLWVHAAQPMLFESVEAIKQRFDRAARQPRLLYLQVSGGTDQVLERVCEFAAVQAAPATGDIGHDLKTLLAGWSSGSEPRWRLNRTASPKPEGQASRQGDIQIVRLWAYEQVLGMIDRPAFGRSSSTDEACDVAVRHHLVTPVSGAVVLETKEQYDAAGLAPVSAIPLPPAVWAILLVAPLLWWATRRYAGAAQRA